MCSAAGLPRTEFDTPETKPQHVLLTVVFPFLAVTLPEKQHSITGTLGLYPNHLEYMLKYYIYFLVIY